MIRIWSVESDPKIAGGNEDATPVAVIDIGSNSVRLVVYERLTRALTVLYNEKSSSGLGRGVAATGNLADETIARALKAVQRFALVCRLMEVGQIYAFATSATRDAGNGPAFTKAVEAIIGVKVHVMSGREEAHFGALGVVAGMPGFEGVVGDLGGGSLELARVSGEGDMPGETFGLGGIRLQDDSGNDPVAAAQLARERLEESEILKDNPSHTFCAIGGTWRSIAKLIQTREKYPLHMVQDYAVSAPRILEICDMLVNDNGKKPVAGMESVSSSRRDLLPYGAAVLAEVVRKGGFERVVFSALGVREGYLYDRLDAQSRTIDPLIEATREMCMLRARAPKFADDLIEGSTELLAISDIEESRDEERLRRAVCYLSDIGWRAHPDYRGEQSVDMVAFSDITGIGHAGRAFLAQTLAYRYMGFKQKSASAKLLALAGEALNLRARLIGAYFRVAYPLAAAMPGIAPRTRFAADGKTLQLHLPADLAFLDGVRLANRLRQLATEAGFKDSRIVVEDTI
ncbi:Ppx/GppA phosphatase family protein [Pelagibacterium montanilacus]|uniref:Ppx/GppA phosphatase family protein n=1 Tax=Pelagibacterium montanilacus TaxID=2185280 RepID=UPI000F8C5D4B|nr:Ppx/GppA phosphatase family protein [Pelagibacterium montanilacus]